MHDQALSYLLFGGFVALAVLVIGFLAIVTLIKAFRGTFFGAASPYQPPVYQPPAAFPQQYRPQARNGNGGSALGNFVVAIVLITLLGTGVVFGLGGEISRQDDALNSAAAAKPEIFEAPESTEPYQPAEPENVPTPPVKRQGPEKYVRNQEIDLNPPTNDAGNYSPAARQPEFFANYALQYGAFGLIDNALKNRDRLSQDGHLVQVADYGDGYYRVLIMGDFITKSDANSYKYRYGLEKAKAIPLR